MKPAIVTALVLFTLVLNGCATMFSKTDYPVSIRSEPTKMDVIVTRSDGNTVHKSTTPTTITLTARKAYFKGENYTIKLMRDDKVVGTTSLNARVDGWYFANLALGGLIGMLIVDPITGAMWSLDTDIVVADDTALAESSEEEPILKIMSLDEVPLNERDSLVRINSGE
ncbi:MAG: hypothetical protein OXG24_05430 [Gammaproteobacteria bacterium]|nr:hypothetical protein [Gammaproteobacteria bacterium]